MAITILEVLGEEERGTRARVRHGDAELTALVSGDVARASAAPEPVLVETDYESVRSCRVLPDFDDEYSGIRQGQGESAVLTGHVHQVFEEDNDTLVDLYLVTGPEFVHFRTSDVVGDEVPLDAGIELVVEGLRFLL